MKRRRQRPAHSWDRLKGTRLEVLELPGGLLRRVCVDVSDAFPAVISFGVHALTAQHDGRPTLRAIAVDNWNADPRELFQIPEAVAWFRRLWADGKPLLRLLSESTADTPPEDRLGLSQRDVSALGFGWFDVWAVAACEIVSAELRDTPDGPVWGLEARGNRTREDVRAELLEMTPANPEGFTFEAAADRRHFMEENAPHVGKAVRELLAAGHADHALVVVSLEDSAGGRMAQVLAETRPGFAAEVAAHRAGGLHTAVVCGIPRLAAAAALDAFAPGAAQRMAAAPPPGGGVWAAFVAFEGTTLAVFTGDE
jgi:hypothetical protein